ncbi:MAG TPA: hypothetical protein PKA38_01225 [Candidatus Levybacteria bacterium]|nr:hypothetical protein [Candidatus Levybacteria bacterium]
MAGFKRYFALFIIFLVIGVNSISPFTVYALDETPTDTPTPTVIEQADPTPTQTTTPTPSPSEAAENTTQANTTEAHDTTAGASNTGENISTTSAELTPPDAEEASSNLPSSNSHETPQSSSPAQQNSSSSITTGDSTTLVSVDNTVNTNSINSQVINQTINIFVDDAESIDLSTPFNLAYTIISQDKNTNPIVNVSVTDAKNYVYLDNDVFATASTGRNEIAEGENALIKTGDAYSVVSLVNKANFTVVDSVIHIVTINIFGDFSGNIILPDFHEETECASCGSSATMKNIALIENDVTADTNTGNNSIDIASSSSMIKTGTSHSIINIVDMVNTNAVGALFQKLFINVLGKWTGNFLGWDSFEPQNGGDTLSLSNNNNDCDCDTALITENTAIVKNTVKTKADTGTNIIHGNDGLIQTGNAYSAVSLINFINSNFFKTNGFFAFINVFGNWSGSIGGASKFITEVTQEEHSLEQISNGDSQEKIKDPESGGKLTVTNKNNVGEFVNPGDTVTFFVDTKNNGTGKIYGAKLLIGLYKDGEFMGGPSFDLEDIEAQKTKRLTTGLVLTNNAPAGHYTALSYVTGTTGKDTVVEATAESYFMVSSKGNGKVLAATTKTGNKTGSKKEIKIAGAYMEKGDNYRNDLWVYYLIMTFLAIFIGIRATKRRALVRAIFIKALPFYTRLRLLKSFLL